MDNGHARYTWSNHQQVATTIEGAHRELCDLSLGIALADFATSWKNRAYGDECGLLTTTYYRSETL